MFKSFAILRAGRILLLTLFLLPPFFASVASGQALNMDGQSGIFFQPLADVVPASRHQFVSCYQLYVIGGSQADDYHHDKLGM